MSTTAPEDKSTKGYNPQVVRFVIRLIRTFLRLGLADAVYVGMGFPFWLLYRTIFAVANTTRFEGLEHLPPPGQGCFILCNHVSMGEGPALGAHFYPKAMWFPSKAEFYSGWFMGFLYLLFTGMHTIPVRRGEKDREAISLVEDLLRRGDRVLLFPEGTRSRDGALLPGKPGVGMIIHAAQPVVIPCYVEGFDRIFRPGQLLLPSVGQKALVRFGPPLDLQRHYQSPFGKESGQAIVDDVMVAIAALKAANDRPAPG